jgi:carboxymethylenebutenolidase
MGEGQTGLNTVTRAKVLNNKSSPVISEDTVVSLESLEKLSSNFVRLGVEKDIHVYEGAGHAFANPSGDSFRRNATRDTWNQTLQFP